MVRSSHFVALCLVLLSGTWAHASSSPLPKRQVPDIPGVGRVSQVDVHGEVDDVMASFIRRVIGEHRKGDILLLDVNTLGGKLESALAIRDALLETDVTTVCWVRPRAISAGALITLACDVVAVAPGSSIGAATPVQLTPDGMKPVEDKIVSYMRTEMANTARMQGRPPLVAEAMVDAAVEVPGLDGADTLLTLDEDKALEWDVADLLAADDKALWALLGRDLPRIERLQPTGAERFAGFVTTPLVVVVLLVIGLMGIAIEGLHPTNGTALMIGLGALAVLFLGHRIASLAAWWELGLIAVGLVLLAVEYFSPGHTLFGVVGFKLVVFGAMLALMSFDHVPFSIAFQSGTVTRAVSSVFGALLVSVVAMVVLARFVPMSRVGRGLILDAAISDRSGADVPAGQGVPLSAMVGEPGIAHTELRPVGKVECLGQIVEGRLERGWVAAGTRVRVLGVDRGQLIVREAAAPERSGSAEASS